MILIWALLAIDAGLGMWAVGSLAAAGHFLEAGCLFLLLFFSVWCAAEFAKRTPPTLGLTMVGFTLCFSLEIAGHMAGGLPPDAFWAWLTFSLQLAAGPLYLELVTRFPLPRPDLRWLVRLACGAAAAVAVAGPLGLLGPAFDPVHPLAVAARAEHFRGGGHSHYASGTLLVMGIFQLIGYGMLRSSRRLALADSKPRVARQALVMMLGAVAPWIPAIAYLPGVLPAGMEVVLHGPPAVIMALGPIAITSALRHPEFHDARGLFRAFLIDVGLVLGVYLLYIALVRPLTLLLDLVRPGAGREPAVFGAALLVALLMRPVKEWITERVDRLFYPHLLGFRTLLQEASHALATTIIPAEVAALVTRRLPVRLGISGACLLVLDRSETTLTAPAGKPLALPQGHPLWAQAYRADGPTGVSEPAICAELGLTGPMLMLPLRVGGRLVGLYILGARQPGVGYSHNELGQLTVLGHNLAVAVENGRALRMIDELSQRALAEVEERNQIAREIHDTIAQGLAAASLQLDVVEATLATDPARAARAAERAQSIVRANLAEARRSVLELRAPLLGTESFPAALGALLNRASEEIGAAGSLQVEGTYRGLPVRVENQLYRIAQEALHNAVKYSSARHLSVLLRLEEGQVLLHIADDGVGFDVDRRAPGNERGGFGLTGMGERARLLGGRLHLHSEPGEGTVVEAIVPVADGEEGLDDSRAVGG